MTTSNSGRVRSTRHWRCAPALGVAAAGEIGVRAAPAHAVPKAMDGGARASSKHRLFTALAIATIAVTTQIPSAAAIAAPPGGVAGPGASAFAGETCGLKPVTILGTEGNDTLIGTEAADVILAGGGTDRVDARGGNDTVCLGLGNDTFSGGGGDDVVVSDSLEADGIDNLNGGPGLDQVSYARRTFGVTVSLDDVTNDGQSGERDNVHSDVESVVGGAVPDTLTGNDGANILSGGGGADNINGLGGVDDLFGDEGDDGLVGGLGNDTISGGGGTDFIESEAVVDGGDSLFGGLGLDTVSYQKRTAGIFGTIDAIGNDGASGEDDNIQLDVENIVGSSAGDFLSVFGPGGPNGVFANNVLNGGPGSDFIRVADGPFITNDTAIGGPDADTCLIDASFDSNFFCEF